LKGCLILIPVPILALIGIAYLANRAPAPEISAATWCAAFIRQRLNDPASAEFDPTSVNMPASKNADGSYTTLLELRANNAFGAKVKAQYLCTVTPGTREREAWREVNISQVY